MSVSLLHLQVVAAASVIRYFSAIRDLQKQIMTTHTQNAIKPTSAKAVVAGLIECARVAQRLYDRYTQQQLDEVVTAAGWAIINPEHNRCLAELAVKDTGLGNVPDKIVKNHRKTFGLLRDLRGAISRGILAEYPARGIIEIARPVGVVAAVVPSTNPGATPANNVINALKCGNAVILSPSPKGYSTCARLVEYIHAEMQRVGAPPDLVQMLPAPVTKELSTELMQQADLVVVTGSRSNVRAAYSSGKPALGVGTGNVVVIVDDSADVPDAAAKIMASKIFDNATSCSSENSVIIHAGIYDAMLAALVRQGGVLLTAAEKTTLQQAMFPGGHLSPAITAQPVSKVCAVAGLTRPELIDAKCLLVEETGSGKDYPFSGEKLSPVLTIYRAHDFDHAFNIMRGIYDYMGNGHSCGIHTRNEGHIRRLGLEMTVCRVIVNQAHTFATGGSFDNGLPFSLSMGCGTWGGNSISENLNYRHFINVTRIVTTIPENQPTEEEVLGPFWKKFGK